MKQVLVISLAILLAACTATSATGNAGIRGRITDGSGYALPGVTVTVIGAAGERTTVTDADGIYLIEHLPPGEYRVAISLADFNTQTRVVKVARNRLTTLQAAISPASIAETITVTSAEPRIDHSEFVRPQYAAFDDHGFIDATKQRVTTFAIDVDRASYANIRRFLTNGEMPPRDAVRIEEMVNYFTYDYPQPSGPEPFSITTEIAGCPWNASARLLRIGIQGRNLEQWKMAPNNLVFLLDVSGSMDSPERLPVIQQAFRLLVEQLRAEDRVAIVVYAGSEGLALPSTSGADKETILNALDALESGGSTAGAAGIELAYQVALNHFIKGGNNRVILATDGDFNVGMTDISALQKLIERKRESGIFLSTIGVGDDNYQDALMETLADKGNGNYNYLDSLKEAEKVFQRELTGTLVTIAKDVKVQLEFDPAYVESYRQIGYENRALENKDFDDDTKDAGELGAGHSVTALYEIVPRASKGGAVGTIKLRYKEPRGISSRMVSAAIVDEGKSVFEASTDLQFAAAVAEMGMLLRNSPHKGTSSWPDVVKLANVARGVDLDGTRTEFAKLVTTPALFTPTIDGFTGAR